MAFVLSSSPGSPLMQLHGSEEQQRLCPGCTSATEDPNMLAPRPGEQQASGIQSKRYIKRSNTLLISLWRTVAFLVGVSLLSFSICGSGRRVQSGATVRKLADRDAGEESSSGANPYFSEDEWIPLDSDELALLCAELGGWAPQAVPHSVSTPSVRMAEAASTSKADMSEYILQSMQKPIDVSVAPSIEQRLSAVGSMHKGKRIPQKYSDGWEPTAKKIGKLAYFGSVETAAEDQSSAVQRLRETAQQPAATSTGFRLVELSAVPTDFSHQQGLAPSLVDLQAAQHVQLAAPAVVQPSPTIARQASSSLSAVSTTPTFETFRYPKEASVHQSVGVAAGQSGSLAPQGHSPHRYTEVSTRLVKLRTLLVPGASNSSSSKHPFVRAPMLMPHVRIEDVEDRIPESLISKDSSVFLLKAVRSLCLKPALDLREANELVRAAISLARRALASMTTPVDKVKPSVAAEALGRRFLVFEAFHRVLKLTGDIKDDLRGLWQALVTKVPTTYARPLRGIYNEEHVFYHTLSRQLSAALELYKNGSSPSEDEILDLKRKLFCTDFSPRGFLRQSWDVWRLDDINFTGTP